MSGTQVHFLPCFINIINLFIHLTQHANSTEQAWTWSRNHVGSPPAERPPIELWRVTGHFASLVSYQNYDIHYHMCSLISDLQSGARWPCWFLPCFWSERERCSLRGLFKGLGEMRGFSWRVIRLDQGWNGKISVLDCDWQTLRTDPPFLPALGRPHYSLLEWERGENAPCSKDINCSCSNMPPANFLLLFIYYFDHTVYNILRKGRPTSSRSPPRSFIQRYLKPACPIAWGIWNRIPRRYQFLYTCSLRLFRFAKVSSRSSKSAPAYIVKKRFTFPFARSREFYRTLVDNLRVDWSLAFIYTYSPGRGPPSACSFDKQCRWR